MIRSGYMLIVRYLRGKPWWAHITDDARIGKYIRISYGVCLG